MKTPIIHIQLDEDGIPRTINRRVKVKMIARKHLEGGMSVADIAEHYDIELSDVYASIAYYYDNKAVMDAERDTNEALLQEVGISHDDLKATVLQRMADKQAEMTTRQK